MQTGLVGQCGNWAWGLVLKLGLGTSVGTRLGGRWKLGLGYIGHSYE